MKHFIIFLTFTFLPLLIFTQQATLNLEWTQTERLNTFGSNVPKVLVDHLGNTFVCANTYDPGPVKGFITLKYDSLGNLLWRKTYDPFTIDVLKDAELLSDGSIVVAGVSEYPDLDGQLKIFRYDTAGDTLWSLTHKIEAGLHTSMNDLLVDDEDNIYVVGRNANENTGIGHLTLTKIDSDGQIVWDNWYNGEGNNHYVGVTGQLLEDKIVVAGKSIGGGAYIIHQVTYDGETIASVQKPYYESFMNSMWLDKEGHTFIGHEGGKYQVTKIDLNGDTLWTYVKPPLIDFPNIAEGSLTNATFDTDNNLYVSGHFYIEGNRADCLTTKLDPNGNVMWEKAFSLTNESLNDVPEAIFVDENYVYLAARCVDMVDEPENYDYTLVVYTLDGEEVTHISYDNKQTDWIKSMFVKDNHIYITGDSNNASEPVYALTQKYRLDIPSSTTTITENMATFSVHPNPATAFLNIDIAPEVFSTGTSTWLRLYDVQGRLVKRVLVSAATIALEVSDLAEGIYFMEISSGNKSWGWEKVVVAR